MKDSIKLSTKEFLVSAGPEKLADILLHIHESKPDMKKQFEMLFQGLDPSPKKLLSMVKKEIGNLAKAKAGARDQKVVAIRDRLEQLRYSIYYDVKRSDVNAAKEFFWEFMDLAFPTIFRIYNNDAIIIPVFKKALENVGQVYKEFREPKIGDLVDIIIVKLSKMRLYSQIYEDIIPAFKDALGKEGLDLLGEKLEPMVKKDNVEFLKHILKSIADAKKDVDLYIRFSNLIDPMTQEDYLHVAEKLIEQWRGDEAIKYLFDSNIGVYHILARRKMELQLQALELCGEYQRAQKERIDYFKQTLEIWIYGEILKHARSEEKESFIQEAINHAMDFLNFEKGFRFLVNMKELMYAGKMVRLRLNTLKNILETKLGMSAFEFHDVDPLAAVLIYRKLIGSLNIDRDEYNIAEILIMCESLKDKIQDWETYPPHDEYRDKFLKKHEKKYYFVRVYEQHMNAYKNRMDEE